MDSISVNYLLIYQFKQSPQYKVSKCLKVFNTKTGRQIKKSYNRGMIGYWIRVNNKKKFVKLGDKKLLELIPKEMTPF